MAYWVWNKVPLKTKRRFFELIRQGQSAQVVSLEVRVSPGVGPLSFIDASSVTFIDTPISGK